jgi:choline dehydrogenase
MSISHEEWDHIVVGGGSAGCALAYRLSHLTGARILLLEAGGNDNSPLIRVPAAALWTVGNPEFDWNYDTDPDPSRDGAIQRCHSGRVLGGGSSINGMIYTRGAPQDFDAWDAGGATGWSYADVLPYFQRAETRVDGNPAFRGKSGPLSVEDPRDIHPTTKYFLAAAQEFGMKLAEDYNGPQQEGAAFAQLTQKRGARCSTPRGYRRLRRSGLVVRTRAPVARLLIEGNRCTGVVYRWRGEQRRAHANSVTVSAGAFGSPKILMLSGIGDRAKLAEHGINSSRHLPGVGKNLADHIGAGVGVHVTIPTYNTQSGFFGRISAAAQWLTARRGPATTPLCQAVAFCRSTPDCDKPDLQLMFSPLAVSFNPAIAVEKGKITPYDRAGVGIYVDLGRPKQRGEVSLRSADPSAPPHIRYDLLGQPEDVATLIRGCRIARDLFQTPALKSITTDERFPGSAVSSDDEWREALKTLAALFHHPTGTCAIGADERSVVDPELRVHGIDGLRVADASVMPQPINGNTNAASIMIAERAADWLSGLPIAGRAAHA